MKHLILITGIIFCTFGSIQLYQMNDNGPCSRHCGSYSGCKYGDSFMQSGWTNCEIMENGSCVVMGSHCNNGGGTPQRL